MTEGVNKQDSKLYYVSSIYIEKITNRSKNINKLH